jgi:hypothetical protein
MTRLDDQLAALRSKPQPVGSEAVAGDGTETIKFRRPKGHECAALVAAGLPELMVSFAPCSDVIRGRRGTKWHERRSARYGEPEHKRGHHKRAREER